MADVEKRKSFADMKLVDFTSGFSNFEVGSKDLNINPSHYQATELTFGRIESLRYLSLAWQC